MIDLGPRSAIYLSSRDFCVAAVADWSTYYGCSTSLVIEHAIEAWALGFRPARPALNYVRPDPPFERATLFTTSVHKELLQHLARLYFKGNVSAAYDWLAGSMFMEDVGLLRRATPEGRNEVVLMLRQRVVELRADAQVAPPVRPHRKTRHATDDRVRLSRQGMNYLLAAVELTGASRALILRCCLLAGLASPPPPCPVAGFGYALPAYLPGHHPRSLNPSFTEYDKRVLAHLARSHFAGVQAAVLEWCLQERLGEAVLLANARKSERECVRIELLPVLP